MRTVAELQDMIGAKRAQLNDIFAKGYQHLNDDEVSDVRQRNSELTDLAKELEAAQEIAGIQQNVKGAERVSANRLPTPQTTDEPPRAKSLRDLLDTNREYQAFKAGATKTARFDFNDAEYKTLITSGDMTPQAQRLPGIVQSVQLPLQVSDMMLQGNTDRASVEYWEETTFTNNAAETAEGGTKPESALDWTLRTDNVRKIPTWIPATDEALADTPFLEAQIRERLGFMVEQRRESQLLNGNGIAPNLQGILNRTGIQTQARGTDPTPDAFYRAMTKVRVTGGAEPTAAIVHPNDWQDIRLLRTADGIYIWGSPADAGVERLWGLNVRVTTAIAENTGLVGAFRPHSMFIRRSGITVTISTEHSTYFVENKVAILAEERVALAVFRPAAFCTVTGI